MHSDIPNIEFWHAASQTGVAANSADCVYINPDVGSGDGRWRDIPCIRQHRFFCNKLQLITAEPSKSPSENPTSQPTEIPTTRPTIEPSDYSITYDPTTSQLPTGGLSIGFTPCPTKMNERAVGGETTPMININEKNIVSLNEGLNNNQWIYIVIAVTSCICVVVLLIMFVKPKKYKKKKTHVEQPHILSAHSVSEQCYATDVMDTDQMIKGNTELVHQSEINDDCEEMYMLGKAEKTKIMPMIETDTPTSVATEEVCEDHEDMYILDKSNSKNTVSPGTDETKSISIGQQNVITVEGGDDL